MDRKEMVLNGRTALGIELGSTRIKAVLIGEDHSPIASGDYEWENQYENNIWTYSLDMVWKGLQESYRRLAEDVEKQYGVALETVGAVGFSAMMHGYMAFSQSGELLGFRFIYVMTKSQSVTGWNKLFLIRLPY